MRSIILLALLVLTGCSSLSAKEEEDMHRWMLPVNVVVGYFGAVGLHEGGHALTGMALGGKDAKVTVWPEKDDNGDWHLGLTTIKFELSKISRTDITLFRVMGPTAMWVGHVGPRLLLRSGQVPRFAQPTLAWFGIFNQIGYYGQTILGLARVKTTDLGQEEAWISGVMLAGALGLDVLDFVYDDPGRYFGVLSGEKFYEHDAQKEKQFGTIAAPSKGGGFFGIWLKW